MFCSLVLLCFNISRVTEKFLRKKEISWSIHKSPWNRIFSSAFYYICCDPTSTHYKVRTVIFHKRLLYQHRTINITKSEITQAEHVRCEYDKRWLLLLLFQLWNMQTKKVQKSKYAISKNSKPKKLNKSQHKQGRKYSTKKYDQSIQKTLFLHFSVYFTLNVVYLVMNI